MSSLRLRARVLLRYHLPNASRTPTLTRIRRGLHLRLNQASSLSASVLIGMLSQGSIQNLDGWGDFGPASICKLGHNSRAGRIHHLWGRRHSTKTAWIKIRREPLLTMSIHILRPLEVGIPSSSSLSYSSSAMLIPTRGALSISMIAKLIRESHTAKPAKTMLTVDILWSMPILCVGLYWPDRPLLTRNVLSVAARHNYEQRAEACKFSIL